MVAVLVAASRYCLFPALLLRLVSGYAFKAYRKGGNMGGFSRRVPQRLKANLEELFAIAEAIA